MGPNPYYAIQPAFTGGEISPDVASRVDLDKYQLALLQAENAIVRPYGAVTKRPGLLYCGAVKTASSPVRLWSFRFSVSVNYLLEFGVGYVRVWREGSYLNVELSTPYTADDLPLLRFVQSVDVLYVACGNHPVKKIMRYAENNWQLSDMDWTQPPMGDLNPDEDVTITPSAVTGSSITLTASEDLFDSSKVGSWMELSQRISNASVSITSGTSSAIGVGDVWKIITHGTWAGTVTIESSIDGGVTWLEERKYTGNSDYNPTETGTVNEYLRFFRAVIHALRLRGNQVRHGRDARDGGSEEAPRCDDGHGGLEVLRMGQRKRLSVLRGVLSRSFVLCRERCLPAAGVDVEERRL